MTLPPDFVKMIRAIPQLDHVAFLETLSLPPSVCVRINSRKPGALFPEGTKVAWCDNAFYLPQRPEFIFDPLLHAGAYYVQEASSTIYEFVTRKLVSMLGGAPLRVLDMCAAPGGKTTAMINGLPDGSFVWANEVVAKRRLILEENLTKWGYPVKVTGVDSSFFSSGEHVFDIVAVDAPCSGEGMMRKEEMAVSQWSTELVKQCAMLQQKILKNAAKAVAPGGFLIFSTCTYNTLENEGNAKFITQELGLTPVDLNLPSDWGIPRGFETELPLYRFMPHMTRGEGLFLSVFRKDSEWEKPSVMESKNTGVAHDRNSKNKKNRSCNKPMPEYSIVDILRHDFPKNALPAVNLSLKDARAYLRGEALSLPPEINKGTVIVKYNDLPLGPVKNIGNRANNLYPKPWRIKRII